MDADRFDALPRSISRTRPRRALTRAFGGLVLGGVAAGASPRFGGAKSCPPCRKKKNGKCKKKQPDGARCGPCRECRNGRCVANPDLDDTACRGDGKCQAGTCHQRPECSGAGDPCLPIPCCSGACSEFCSQGMAGRPCLDDQDCGSGSCLGYRCA